MHRASRAPTRCWGCTTGTLLCLVFLYAQKPCITSCYLLAAARLLPWLAAAIMKVSTVSAGPKRRPGRPSNAELLQRFATSHRPAEPGSEDSLREQSATPSARRGRGRGRGRSRGRPSSAGVRSVGLTMWIYLSQYCLAASWSC